MESYSTSPEKGKKQETQEALKSYGGELNSLQKDIEKYPNTNSF